MARIATLAAQLNNVVSLLRKMGDRIADGLDILTHFLEDGQPEQLLQLITLSVESDSLEAATDAAVLQILATQQPLARDLRLAYSSSKIANYLERMSDYLESIARQMAALRNYERKDLLQRMLLETSELYHRVYAAMFERDFGLIHDIHARDDKVDLYQREVFFCARAQLCKNPGSVHMVEDSILLVNISTNLEKFADLVCRWAEEIDFIEHGSNRKLLEKPKPRIGFLDNDGGLSASLAGSLLATYAEKSFEISVLTRRSERISGSVLRFASELHTFGITPQVFPIATIETATWKRCPVLVLLGDFSLSDRERDSIPYKTLVVQWSQLGFSHSDISEDEAFPEALAQELGTHLNKLRVRIDSFAKQMIG